MSISAKTELTDTLTKFGFSFSKSLGQNFLIDENILNKIVDASCIDGDTNVLEIGPGAGTLTRKLCERAKKVAAVEIDSRLIPVLSYNLKDFDNFILYNQDIMKTDLRELTDEAFGGEKFCVVANLPYYITTPIIMSFLECELNISSMTLMVQKEAADRIIANPGGKEYGALTVAVQFYSSPEIVCTVSPHCFTPQPKVTSSVIQLNVYNKQKYSVNNKDKFFKIVKSIFSQRRKTLVNGLSKSPFINADKSEIEKTLIELGLDTKIRGEKLSIEQLVEFSNKVSIN